ncbi:MAG: hypothetical protein U0610_29015 [bacterium]
MRTTFDVSVPSQPPSAFSRLLGCPRKRGRFIRLPFARGLGVLLRSIFVEREPIYRQAETVATLAPRASGRTTEQTIHVGDDAIGRALDHLSDADRASLLTALVVVAGERFELHLDELHNASTTVRFCGQYPAARGRSIRGKRAPFISYSYSKDQRPNWMQYLRADLGWGASSVLRRNS